MISVLPLQNGMRTPHIRSTGNVFRRSHPFIYVSGLWLTGDWNASTPTNYIRCLIQRTPFWSHQNVLHQTKRQTKRRIMDFDPVILAVCLFIIGTTVLTWCFGIPFQTKLQGRLLIFPVQLCGCGPLNRGRLYPILEGVRSPLSADWGVD